MNSSMKPIVNPIVYTIMNPIMTPIMSLILNPIMTMTSYYERYYEAYSISGFSVDNTFAHRQGKTYGLKPIQYLVSG